jgi:hypothetical protein
MIRIAAAAIRLSLFVARCDLLLEKVGVARLRSISSEMRLSPCA